MKGRHELEGYTKCAGEKGRFEMSRTIGEKFDRIGVLLGSKSGCKGKEFQQSIYREISNEGISAKHLS